MSKSESITNKPDQQANKPTTQAIDQAAEDLLISQRVNRITRATEAAIRDAMTMTKPTTMSHFFLEKWLEAGPSRRVVRAHIQPEYKDRFPNTPITVAFGNIPRSSSINANFSIQTHLKPWGHAQYDEWILNTKGYEDEKSEEIDPKYKKPHEGAHEIAEKTQDPKISQLLKLLINQYLAVEKVIIMEVLQIDEKTLNELITQANKLLKDVSAKIHNKNDYLLLSGETAMVLDTPETRTILKTQAETFQSISKTYAPAPAAEPTPEPTPAPAPAPTPAPAPAPAPAPEPEPEPEPAPEPTPAPTPAPAPTATATKTPNPKPKSTQEPEPAPLSMLEFIKMAIDKGELKFTNQIDFEIAQLLAEMAIDNEAPITAKEIGEYLGENILDTYITSRISDINESLKPIGLKITKSPTDLRYSLGKMLDITEPEHEIEPGQAITQMQLKHPILNLNQKNTYIALTEPVSVITSTTQLNEIIMQIIIYSLVNGDLKINTAKQLQNSLRQTKTNSEDIDRRIIKYCTKLQMAMKNAKGGVITITNLNSLLEGIEK